MKNKALDRLIFIDTETGGTDPQKHSLLSIGLAVWDRGNGLLDSAEYFLKNENYVVTNTARGINKFDESEHNLKCLDGKEVLANIKTLTNKYFPSDYLIPLAGHNVQFDIGFLKAFYQEMGTSYNKIFSHRSIDTYSILRFLVYTNRIEEDISSSAKAFQYFGIKVNQRHSALGDVLATVDLFEKMLRIME